MLTKYSGEEVDQDARDELISRPLKIDLYSKGSANLLGWTAVPTAQVKTWTVEELLKEFEALKKKYDLHIDDEVPE